jgi:hypothetical protein
MEAIRSVRDKQHQKLIKLAQKAEVCTSRDKAQKLIRKATKAHEKLAQISA